MYKIIFVDDEAITLQLLRCVLDWEALGITVAGCASDGKEALLLCRKVSPDIIIADIKMPGMTGVMLSEMIRKSNQEVKIIFLSAYAEFEYAQSAIANKVSGYLLKPLDEDQLETLIRKVTAELDREREEKQTSSEARSSLHSARIRDSYLKWLRDGGDADMEPYPPVSRVLCILLSCPEKLAYLSGTEDLVRTAVRGIAESGVTVVSISSYEMYLLPESMDITSDKLLLELGKYGMNAVCGVCGRAGSLPVMMSRARAAAESTFFTGNAIGVWKEDSAGGALREQGYHEYEDMIQTLLETGDPEPLKVKISRLVREAAEKEVQPSALFAAVQDILIWLKSGMMRIWPDTELAAGALRHVDAQRLRACRSPEGLIRYLEALLTELGAAIRSGTAAGGSSAVIRRARMYAAQHASEAGFSLQEAADHAGLSRNHFSKVFHDGTGVKFWDYVTELRIRSAKKLLAETDLPIGRIAEQVGYETEAHLNRKFKQLEGMTPGQYRRKYG